MSYKRRRGLGGGRGAKGGGRGGDPPRETPSADTEDGAQLPEGTAASAAPPRAPTLTELFAAGSEAEPAQTSVKEGRSWGRWLISAAVVAAFFGGGYLAAAQWVFPGGTPAEDASVVQVPELVGLTEDEAQGRLERVGLEYTVRSGITHHQAPEGAVLAQDPLPGQYARPGAPVYVSLSRGPELHVLPDVSGLSDRQAVIVLERLGYQVSVEEIIHTLEAGRAVETRPEAGTELAVPAEIVLVVSGGRPVVQVPELVGRHVDDAEAALSAAGLELGAITYDPGALEAPGRIVGQYPPAGYSLREGGGVEVRVAGDVNRVDPTRRWYENERPDS
ncbi:MAG: PASTA domain-containing protein [marine benthic group bacterium]|jgi:serine/threonine-protein kinase|nr:PASTA domain-containing protein [Candidatus Benthicola marisminoris]